MVESCQPCVRVAPEHIRALSEREATQTIHAGNPEAESMYPQAAGNGIFQYEDFTMEPSSIMPETEIIQPTVPPNILTENPQAHMPSSNPSTPQPDEEPPNVITPLSSGYAPTTPTGKK